MKNPYRGKAMVFDDHDMQWFAPGAEESLDGLYDNLSFVSTYDSPDGCWTIKATEDGIAVMLEETKGPNKGRRHYIGALKWCYRRDDSRVVAELQPGEEPADV